MRVVDLRQDEGASASTLGEPSEPPQFVKEEGVPPMIWRGPSSRRLGRTRHWSPSPAAEAHPARELDPIPIPTYPSKRV